MSYTEEVLDKLNKRELIGMVLSLQSKETKKNDLILEEICKLNHKFSQLELKNVDVNQTNSLLSTCLVNMEGQCWEMTSITEANALKWCIFLTPVATMN